MKLLCTGDWHLRIKPPENRLGDFFGDEVRKVEWIEETALKHGCEVILQPGDLGDNSTWADYLKSYVIDLLKHYGIPILCVAGQHDQRYHSIGSLDRTSLGVLEAAGVVDVLSDKPCSHLFDGKVSVAFYGASFGEEIPAIAQGYVVNILVIHKMILKSGADRLWSSQHDYADAKVFMRNHPEFDLIVSGDNHQGFIVEHEGRVLVNCGALMRTVASKEMFEHKPFVVVYDTVTGDFERIDIPVKPAEEVLDRGKVEERHDRDERLEAFVQGLSEEYSVDLDFRKNLDEFLLANKVESGVRQIVEEVLGD